MLNSSRSVLSPPPGRKRQAVAGPQKMRVGVAMAPILSSFASEVSAATVYS
jgi:hypothetical protein